MKDKLKWDPCVISDSVFWSGHYGIWKEYDLDEMGRKVMDGSELEDGAEKKYASIGTNWSSYIHIRVYSLLVGRS